MSTTYTIGPTGPTAGSARTAIFQPGRSHGQVAVFNTGTETCYLDHEQPIRSTDGQPLSAGSSIPWDEDLPLYAVCPTSTTLVVSENTAIPFDAGAIAAQLNQQGLAQDIADAIHISGVPPTDRYTLIDDSGPFANGVGYFSDPIDVSGYQSLSLAFVNGGTIINPGQLSITWRAADGTATVDILGYDDATMGQGQLTQIVVPVRGPWVTIYLSGTTGGGQIKTYGSYKAVQNTYYVCTGPQPANGALEGTTTSAQTWAGTIPVGATWTWQPDTTAGPGRLILRYVGTSSVAGFLRVPTTIYALTVFLSVTGATANGQTDVYDLVLPPMPTELVLTNSHASSSLVFRATYVPQRPYA